MTQHLLKTPIAVVGMACRLPGAGDVTEFWRLLREGRDAISEMPADRLDRSLYYHAEKGQRGKTYSTLGGFIPERPLSRAAKLLPASLFANADRCHQIFCDVALEACEQGGMDIRNFPIRNTGVYVGHSAGSNLGGELAFATLAEETLDYLFDIPEFAAIGAEAGRSVIRNTAHRLRRTRPTRQVDGGPDFEANFGSALVAKALRLSGPHFVIDAACASSLVALSAAALALNHGSIDAAIVGGASYNKGDSLILFSHAHSCSARGTCPFDSQADGLISSEGYVALLVKLLPKAIADGDTIHAVIRGIGISSDGRGRSLWAPRKEGQIEAIRRAYGSGLDPQDVQYIEAHATSTQVGDATELEALAEFFQPVCAANNKRLPIGSVKSNIGHTLETAGLAGLLKTILALKHGEIPPTVHIQKLHPGIPWDRLPFTVPTQAQVWARRSAEQSRCGAVNAFGIGGLNVHVVVEEFIPTTTVTSQADVTRLTPSATTPAKPEPIAIIGRGVILPGASSVGQFEALLKSRQSMIQDAPESRWRKRIGVRSGKPETWTSPLARGGYITDYAYDWKANKIPPKQVAQANPLQFMLLDAARAALAESGYDKKPFDQMTAAVVVGSVFGGEFGNHLTIGLRLPEIRRDLSEELIARGQSRAKSEAIANEFEQRLLEAKPALLDETGSFTSSTLASRVAKTLNLMGGAMAIDAGDCSSFAALSLACDLLRSNANSMVFCAAAQRAMDLPAFESLARHGRLAGCAGSPSQGYLPGEGVALLLLKRLDDARRDGDAVLGVIEGVAAGMDAAELSCAVEIAGRRALATSKKAPTEVSSVLRGCGVDSFDQQEDRALAASYSNTIKSSPNQLVQQIGHTQAAHGLASVIKATIEVPNQSSGISVHASSGLAYHALVSPAVGVLEKQSPGNEIFSSVATPSAEPRIIRFFAVAESQLFAQLDAALGKIASVWDKPLAVFPIGDGIRLAIVANSPSDLADKIALARNAGSLAKGEDLLRERGIFYSTRSPRQPRVAFVFPGQGSQYPGMLRETVQRSSAARCALADADRILAEFGFATFAELAWQNPERLGIDVWTTQMAMLVADYVSLAAAHEIGLAPDCVVGHSFGEFAALVAAGAIHLRQAIKLTDERAKAVEEKIEPAYGMLSVKASLSEVEPFLKEYAGRLFLSHHNSPEQIVFGGFAEALGELEASLAWKNIATRRLQVPTAYHTPFMQPMMGAWTAALAREKILPPRTLLLSSVTTKYVADPDEIRDNLAAQLVTPVHYVQLLKRLVCDQLDALVEVGPNQVLTQLHRRTLHDRGLVLTSLDHPKRSAGEQAFRVIAELECIGWKSASSNVDHRSLSQGGTTSTSRQQSRPSTPIEHFDATAGRKQRRRTESRSIPVEARPREPIEAFDATQKRRSMRRQSERTPEPLNTEAIAVEETIAVAAPAQVVDRSQATASSKAVNIDQILIDFVVEHTGYPANLINFDWDMEADLGIDSIKRAQLFGELRDLFHLQPKPGGSLDDYRTLRQIADLLRDRLENLDPAENAANVAVAPAVSSAAAPPDTPRLHVAVVNNESVAPSSSEEKSSPFAPPDVIHDESAVLCDKRPFEQVIIDFVVDQTGYPPDVVDLDADFEADLGIDSIKKAQLFGELRDQFGLAIGDGDRLELSQFRTVRQILAFLDQFAPANSPVSALAGPDVLKFDEYFQAARDDEHEIWEAVPSSTQSHSEQDFARSPDQPSFESSPINSTQLLTASAHHGRNVGPRYDLGIEKGRRHAKSIRVLLRRMADCHSGNGHSQTENRAVSPSTPRFSAGDLSEIQGLADGAGVHFENILAYQRAPLTDMAADAILRVAKDQECSLPANHVEIAHRYALRTLSSPQRPGCDTQPKWNGAAVILGQNELSEQIRQRFVRDGRNAYVIAATDDPRECVAELDRIWQQEPAPHLFITTPRESEAATTWNIESFDRRRRRGVTTPFWFCQRWVKLAITSGLIDSASMVGVLSLGGDFGFNNQPISVESGAISGLFKSIIIENWVSGFRTTPIKLIDAPARESTPELVEAIWRELAVPSFDCEIAWSGSNRQIVRAIRKSVDGLPHTSVTRGGVWVCTGGARGITAYVAQQLALRYGLKLHLLGLSPPPAGPHVGRSFSESELRHLRIDVMQAARERGQSPVKEWEKVEKSFEIHHTLESFRDLGVNAEYHSCDVADRNALQQVLEKIRAMDGPIQGILHGAGVGKDARFDRKEPERVEQCIRAKVDGARNLMELTSSDPLAHFVSFGSISGRFGANGHTDYSLANDMLCKLMDWYRHERPEVHSVGFHWHAWGDVGMAMKPETKLALEMVGMQFMPAAEGVAHLINELESKSPESEILITDDKYYRLFYPAETLTSVGEKPNPAASKPSLLADVPPEIIDGVWTIAVELDPTREPFLIEHRLDDRPLLPIVIAMELMAEAAACFQGSGQVLGFQNLEAVQGLRFFTDRPQTIRIRVKRGSQSLVHCELIADFCSRDGRLVEANRIYLKGDVKLGAEREVHSHRREGIATGDGDVVEYAPQGSKFFLGSPLRRLKKIQMGTNCAMGRIIAPSLIELAGGHRTVDGWIVPSAAIDASLYATGLLCWSQVSPGATLPVRFGAIEFGRMPDPGEACDVEVRFIRRDGRHAVFDFTLRGSDGSVLVHVSDYYIAWIGG